VLRELGVVIRVRLDLLLDRHARVRGLVLLVEVVVPEVAEQADSQLDVVGLRRRGRRHDADRDGGRHTSDEGEHLQRRPVCIHFICYSLLSKTFPQPVLLKG
jgi:hypothetical protein